MDSEDPQERCSAAGLRPAQFRQEAVGRHLVEEQDRLLEELQQEEVPELNLPEIHVLDWPPLERRLQALHLFPHPLHL